MPATFLNPGCGCYDCSDPCSNTCCSSLQSPPSVTGSDWEADVTGTACINTTTHLFSLALLFDGVAECQFGDTITQSVTSCFTDSSGNVWGHTGIQLSMSSKKNHCASPPARPYTTLVMSFLFGTESGPDHPRQDSLILDFDYDYCTRRTGVVPLLGIRDSAWPADLPAYPSVILTA